MVTITVRSGLRYSPLNMACEKRPERLSPTSVTPFSLAALLARASRKVGLTLAPITTLNVLAILALPKCYFAETSSSSTTCLRVSNISKDKRTMPPSLPLTSK
jgi:hypothetical protein